MNEKYPMIFSPGSIGNVKLKNRIVMSAIGMNQSDDGFVNDAVLEHYAVRARGGIGLIIVEVSCVDAPLGKNTGNPLVIDDDKYIPGMQRLTDVIHAEGTKCFLQISHAGRGAFRRITGMQPVAPSAVSMPYSTMMELSNETPRELTVKEIHNIEEKYAQAAFRAKKAGFDGVEIHNTGYYLGQQFLSSVANVRTDEYGGNRENRIRFLLNIIRRIRELCGNEFPIAVKLSVVESGEDAGITMKDGIYYAKRLQDVGVNAIEVLAGVWSGTKGNVAKAVDEECQMTGLCQILKREIRKMTGKNSTIKIIGGGHVQHPQAAEKALEEHQCEFVFVGRELLVQPDFVKLIEEGREDEIKHCIGCGTCSRVQLQKGETCRCVLNPDVGQIIKENRVL